MTERKKFIGNEQPLPIDIINECIIEYLETGTVNKDNLLVRLKARNIGENRAGKAAIAIYSVITRQNSVSKSLRNEFTGESYRKLSEDDKRVVIMSLVCIRFPFNYDLLFNFAKLFNVQDTVNRQYINEKMSSLYGSNLSLGHGITAAIAIAVDCGFIRRVKPGLFSKGELVPLEDFARTAWCRTLCELNGSKHIYEEDLEYEPAMAYLGKR